MQENAGVKGYAPPPIARVSGCFYVVQAADTHSFVIRAGRAGFGLLAVLILNSELSQCQVKLSDTAVSQFRARIRSHRTRGHRRARASWERCLATSKKYIMRVREIVVGSHPFRLRCREEGAAGADVETELTDADDTTCVNS